MSDHYEREPNGRVRELEAEVERLTGELAPAYATGMTLLAENKKLRAALEIIAGERQCLDNLMSNVEVARAALRGGE